MVTFNKDERPIMKIDNPHKPWGPHVDIITPLDNGIPGIQKIRIDPTGRIMDEDFNVRRDYPNNERSNKW